MSTSEYPTVSNFCEKIADYEKNYRLDHLGVDPEPYDLIHDWDADKPWPNAEHQGVYAIFCEEMELLYVGKASLSSSLGARLASYFVKNLNGPGAAIRSGHSWTRTPGYVFTAKVNKAWEAPSLEEYLITELQPSDNQRK